MLLFFILVFVTSSRGEVTRRLIEPPLRVDLQPPEEYRNLPTRSVATQWITMPLDHFDPQNAGTFQMRFMTNEQFFGGDGSPIFLMVGGEWAINAGWLLAGNMFEMARENSGYLVYTEHRYYGATLPFLEFTAENLRYLNVDQALADLAYFIREMKKQPRFAESKVILYGGSYAGNMVLWFKQRYPHLVEGVVASSAPIEAKADFTGYLETVHEAFLSEGGQQCVDTIKRGVDDTMTALRSETGRKGMESAYRLCEPLDYDDPYDLAYFSGLISWTFSSSVQSARPGQLLAICDNLATDFYAKAWYYQTCTEYGYYQTAPNIGTAFDGLTYLNINFYVDVCKRVFDPRFDIAFVYGAVARVNRVFGALTPAVNNTINIHGTVDPWHALGVHGRDLSETSPTITVPRASHCFDMQSWLTTDTIRMTQAQQRARRLVANWLT